MWWNWRTGWDKLNGANFHFYFQQLSNFRIFQFLGRKFFYQSSDIFKGFLNKKFRPILKLDVFNFEN